MNNQIEITKNIARRNLDRAESALSQALLGVRDITPQHKAGVKARRDAQEDKWAANTKRVIDARIDFQSAVNGSKWFRNAAGKLDFQQVHDQTALGPFSNYSLDTETTHPVPTAGALDVREASILWAFVYRVNGTETRFTARTLQAVARAVRGLDALFAS